MDDRTFDALTRTLSQGGSRRKLLKGLLGFGGAVAVTGTVLGDDANAARRGFAGPTFPTPPPCQPSCDGLSCGDDGCGGACACGEGRTCLSNGSCAISCSDTSECRALGCEACWTTTGGLFCGNFEPSINNFCQNDSNRCPVGFVCSGSAFCVPLC